jgi:hypothetical protein
MAVIISVASGNLTAATSVWAAIETGTGASQLVRTSSTNTTGSTVFNANGNDFTGTNTNSCDGLLMFCNRVNTTGTVKVVLSQDSGTTETKTVTVNASDLPVDPSWVFFKFATPLALDGGTDYAIGIQGSSAGNATFFRSGTAADWTHRLRLSTLSGGSALVTVAAGDVMYIVGEHTGQGATTIITITMNSTATTDYGTGSDGTVDNGVEIGDSGILSYGVAGTTNYYFKLSGSLNLWGNGTLNIGPIPRTSTAVLEFDPVADGGMGLIQNAGGILSLQGLSRTSGKNIYYCKLNIDAVVASTNLGVDTDTGWLDNDVIVVASTTRTAADCEKGALNGNAGASALTVDSFAGGGGGLAVAHQGTSPTQAEVILLTRNVVVRSATSTIMAYVFLNGTSVASSVDIDWVEFYYLGENAVNKHGINIANSLGTVAINYCSIHDTEDWGVDLPNVVSVNNVTFSNNVMWNCNTVALSGVYSVQIAATTGTAITFDSNIFIFGACNNTAHAMVNLADFGITFTNNTVIGAVIGAGILFNEASVVSQGPLNNNVIHSCASAGFLGSSDGNVNITGLTVWRCNAATAGVVMPSNVKRLSIITNLIAFGNATNNVGNSANAPFILNEPIIYGDASPATLITPVGIQGINSRAWIFNGQIGVALGHSTADLGACTPTQRGFFQCFNTVLGSTTEIQSGGGTGYGYECYYRLHKSDQSAVYKQLSQWGTIISETSIRHTASGFSWKMTPTTANTKLILPGPTSQECFKHPVNASSLVTITVYVLKDAAYNGNAARLVILGDVLGGIVDDVTTSYSKTTKTITGATNATPIVITAVAHGYSNGDVVLIEGVLTNTAANGTWTVANKTADTFELTGSVGNGAYGGAGTANVFELLTVTATPNEVGVIEWYIDADGTAGNIYVDDENVTQ